jgi:hypothetical protein
VSTVIDFQSTKSRVTLDMITALGGCHRACECIYVLHGSAGAIRVPGVGWQAARGRAEASGTEAAGAASDPRAGQCEAPHPRHHQVVSEVSRLRTDVMYEAIREAVARATKWLYFDEEPARGGMATRRADLAVGNTGPRVGRGRSPRPSPSPSPHPSRSRSPHRRRTRRRRSASAAVSARGAASAGRRGRPRRGRGSRRGGAAGAPGRGRGGGAGCCGGCAARRRRARRCSPRRGT